METTFLGRTAFQPVQYRLCDALITAPGLIFLSEMNFITFTGKSVFPSQEVIPAERCIEDKHTELHSCGKVQVVDIRNLLQVASPAEVGGINFGLLLVTLLTDPIHAAASLFLTAGAFCGKSFPEYCLK